MSPAAFGRLISAYMITIGSAASNRSRSTTGCVTWETGDDVAVPASIQATQIVADIRLTIAVPPKAKPVRGC